MTVAARSYLSPTLVLLAYDWPDGDGRDDFLGFAIERSPGFNGAASSWLPNRLGFSGPDGAGDSNVSPIQKFSWWDARIHTEDRGSTITYRVVPVVGRPGALQLLDDQAATVPCEIPHVTQGAISTWFNRAVVSSQSFARNFGKIDSDDEKKRAMAWLANGMEEAIPDFFTDCGDKSVNGAIYHLAEPIWIEPAFASHDGPLDLVYHDKPDDQSTAKTVATLRNSPNGNRFVFHPRTKANIMHDKFLVRCGGDGTAQAVMMGSANYTTTGIAAQANVIHRFESPSLADLYLKRQKLLAGDPAMAATRAAQTGWSDPVQVDDASIRVIFPPEKKPNRASLDAVCQAVRNAKRSVIFCCFTPTDQEMLNDIFAEADEGKMMFGLVNDIPDKEPELGKPGVGPAAITLFHRSLNNRDVIGGESFGKNVPQGFSWEQSKLGDELHIIRIHHKFVVIDAETDSPTIFVGSANLSNNALYNNDENMVEITGAPWLARTYFAEFMRLYEHYRARSAFERGQDGPSGSFSLTADSSWAKKYFVPDSPEQKARLSLAYPPS